MKKQNRRIKVAVIDDSEYLREGLSFMIKNFGFEISFQAENGYECLEKLSELREPPDVCLLDIYMPMMNGFETAREIKARWPTIKIVACSTINEQAIIEEIIGAGADFFLLKGNDPKEFKEAILQLTDTKDSKQFL